IDKVFDWALVWGERRKAAEQKAPIEGNGFDSSGCKYPIEVIEQIVREGPPAGTNRSDVFHTIVGHYVGCGWQIDRILEHVQQHPDGIGSRYLREDRLRQEISRSAGKYAKTELPLLNEWTDREAPQPESPTQEPPPDADPELDEPEAEPEPGIEDDDLDDDEDLNEEAQDPSLPRLYAHGDPDPRPLKSWLIKHLMPEIGHGLMSGQWGAGKTFTFFDLA